MIQLHPTTIRGDLIEADMKGHIILIDKNIIRIYKNLQIVHEICGIMAIIKYNVLYIMDKNVTVWAYDNIENINNTKIYECNDKEIIYECVARLYKKLPYDYYIDGYSVYIINKRKVIQNRYYWKSIDLTLGERFIKIGLYVEYNSILYAPYNNNSYIYYHKCVKILINTLLLCFYSKTKSIPHSNIINTIMKY
jgi:hypothetical protein